MRYTMAIAMKEIKGYFTSPVAYVVALIFVPLRVTSLSAASTPSSQEPTSRRPACETSCAKFPYLSCRG